ncbi:MAG TPA: carbohydrate kinase [Candidatus Acidoferrum sp.]|nr:carbohydrate kinase [Candidatus Acidoferrum sp.]
MILVCGEALVDLFILSENGARLGAEAVAGGSPFNVAIGLARLGCPAALCTGLSTDRFGRLLTDVLSREGVNLDYAMRTPRLTTISVVATDREGHPVYSFHGEGAADRNITIADLKPDLPPAIEAVTFGSYTTVVEPVAGAYLALAQREAEQRIIFLDPNIRPTVIGDIRNWPSKFRPFLRTATIVKASDEDIATAYGADTSIADVARDWMAQGPSLVVVTRGGNGAVAFLGERTIEVPGRKVDVVDTVGAGDTFSAALLAGLRRFGRLAPKRVGALDLETLGSVLSYAIIASSITCSRRGADLPTASDVEAVLAGATAR